MCSPSAASCIAADRPASFGQPILPYRSCWDRPGCRARDLIVGRWGLRLGVPFRVFGSAVWGPALPRGTILSELAARLEFQPAEVPPVLVRRSRFAVGHSLGFAVFPRRACRPQSSDLTNLSTSFALRQSIIQRFLADRPGPADSSHGLWLPSAHQGSEVH